MNKKALAKAPIIFIGMTKLGRKKRVLDRYLPRTHFRGTLTLFSRKLKIFEEVLCSFEEVFQTIAKALFKESYSLLSSSFQSFTLLGNFVFEIELLNPSGTLYKQY